MKKTLSLIIIFIIISGLCSNGCVRTKSSIATPNRVGLLKLSIGMTKAEALETMPKGKETVTPFAGPYTGLVNRGVTITNPYRSEILKGNDKTLEVIYYVTDVKTSDKVVTDDELTPLVFENGILIGWGWSLLKDNVQKYEIRMR